MNRLATRFGPLPLVRNFTHFYLCFGWCTQIMHSLEPLLAPTRVARLLRVEVETLASWRRREYGPRWYGIGKKIKYAEEELRLWTQSQASWVNGQARRVVRQ